MIRLPEDNRERLFRSASFACDKLNDAVVAVTLLFTTIGIFGFLLDLFESSIHAGLYSF